MRTEKEREIKKKRARENFWKNGRKKVKERAKKMCERKRPLVERKKGKNTYK